jgi:hypothetical protein
VKIADVVGDASFQPQHLDPERVAHYRNMNTGVPPVMVFATEEGLLLVDGHHRVAAAIAAGETTIEANVRQGSRSEALEWAVRVGAEQRGVSRDEARQQILRRRGT